MKFLKPKIVVSKCLEFDNCRYDGQMINNEYIQKLKKFNDFQPICPELEIKMGTPRDPIHIITEDNKTILYQKSTGLDFSSKMDSFSDDYLSKIKKRFLKK